MPSPYRCDFDMPRDVAYLSAASYSPMPLVTQGAGRDAMRHKGQPWRMPAGFIEEQNEQVRAAAALLINADADDVALIPSVGYGYATLGKLLPVPAGSRVLVLEDDHASPVLEWQQRAPTQGFVVETVVRPDDFDWTVQVMRAIDRNGAPPVAIVSISSVHWTDGVALDMARIAAATRACGALLLVDATQHVGALPLDVRTLDPDAVIFPTYKWLLGPYGRAFLYLARRHQSGVPLEQTAHGRRDVRAENDVYMRDADYVATARRFDMGERDHFVSMPMTAASLDYLADIGPNGVSAHVRPLTDRLARGIEGLPIRMAPAHLRAPHMLCLGFQNGRPSDLSARLARHNVFAALRIGKLRFSPHLYNDEDDIDRAITALRDALA